MKLTKLQKQRYAIYLERRRSGDGLNALQCAKYAFREVPKPPKPQTELLIASVREAQAVLQREIEVIKKNRALINRVTAIVKRYDRNPYIYSSAGKICISLSVHGLDGFKKGLIPRLIGVLERAAGVVFSRTQDYADNGERDFHGESDLFKIRIDGYLKDAPKACRKVLVREEVRVVRQPVYELRCD